MDKKKKIIVAGLAVAALAAYTGIVFYSARKDVEKGIAEKAQLKEDTLNYLTTEHTPQEIEDTLIDAFSQLDKEDNTQILDALIYGTYNAAASVMMSDEETDALYHVMNEDHSFNFDEIEDEELKENIEILTSQHVVPRYVNGSMFYDVDYGYFAETFKDYINEDYYEVLDFYDEEKLIDYVDADNALMITDVVTGRLDKLYDMVERNQDSEILDIMDEAYVFYKTVYLGAYSQDYIFTDDAKIKEDVLASYKEYKDVCKDRELSTFLETLIADYEEADLYRTVPIMESIKDFCGFNDGTVSTASTATEAEAEEATVVPANEE